MLFYFVFILSYLLSDKSNSINEITHKNSTTNLDSNLKKKKQENQLRVKEALKNGHSTSKRLQTDWEKINLI